MELRAHKLSLSYGKHRVIDELSVDIDPHQTTVVIGPNGCGKSTLLSALAGLLHPVSGQVSLNGKPVNKWGRKALARQLAFLPQQPQAPQEISVRDLVAHGRFAHRRPFAPQSEDDHAAIDWALQVTSTRGFSERTFGALSGGERQRVWIALALAQSPRMLLLDEPTSFLDVGYQYQVLDLLRSLDGDQRPGLLMVLHDINQASFYADRIIALKAGRIIADGPPEEVITRSNVQTLFGVDMRIMRSEKAGRLYCLPEHL